MIFPKLKHYTRFSIFTLFTLEHIKSLRNNILKIISIHKYIMRPLPVARRTYGSPYNFVRNFSR